MRWAFLLLALAASAEDADPITDRLRFELALSQRNVLITRAQYDTATAYNQQKRREAQQACEKVGQIFSDETFTCTRPK